MRDWILISTEEILVLSADPPRDPSGVDSLSTQEIALLPLIYKVSATTLITTFNPQSQERFR